MGDRIHTTGLQLSNLRELVHRRYMVHINLGNLNMDIVNTGGDYKQMNYSRALQTYLREAGTTIDSFEIDRFPIEEIGCVLWGLTNYLTIKETLLCLDYRVIENHILVEGCCMAPDSFHNKIARRAMVIRDPIAKVRELITQGYYINENGELKR